MHIAKLHYALEGELFRIIVKGGIVEELGFESVVFRRCVVIIFEKPAHFNDSVVVVRAV